MPTKPISELLTDRFVSREQVLELVPLNYTSIWRKMQDGSFPRGRAIGGKTVWLASELNAWMKNRPVRKLKRD